MGTAIINRRSCIAWEKNLLCLICDEICPYDAIEYRVIDEYTGPQKKPFVLEKKCVGCGMCEQKCPVKGKAAVVVVRDGEERIREGSYITGKKKKLREIESKEFETEGIGGGSSGKSPAVGKTGTDTKSGSGEGKLPPGFLPADDEAGGGELPAGFLPE